MWWRSIGLEQEGGIEVTGRGPPGINGLIKNTRTSMFVQGAVCIMICTPEYVRVPGTASVTGAAAAAALAYQVLVQCSISIVPPTPALLWTPYPAALTTHKTQDGKKQPQLRTLLLCKCARKCSKCVTPNCKYAYRFVVFVGQIRSDFGVQSEANGS